MKMIARMRGKSSQALERHGIQEPATDSEKVVMSTITQQPVFIIEVGTRTCRATASRL